MAVAEQELNTNERQEQAAPLRTLLGIRNFRLLWIGQGISLMGDQFQFIALPWLVLKLTGDGFAIGTVMAVAGIPRALFMLVGGALTDRFSPRRVMLFSNLVRMALVLGLAVMVLSGTISLWMVYLFALGFGLADAFFYPAQSSIIPHIVENDQFQLANSITQGTAQISLFAGPVLAGGLIAALSRSSAPGGSLEGVGLALIFDALTFLVSVATLWAMRVEGENAHEGEVENVLGAIGEGLRYVWDDTVLRTIFFLIAAADFLIVGPIDVGIPLLADTRLAGGAAAYGIIMSAFGAGSLVGIGLAGVLPRPSARVLGTVLLVVWSFVGFAMVPLGLLSNTSIIAGLMLVAGAANFYVMIVFMTWLQERVPEAMLGRVMSLMMFFSTGLLPVSMALSGVLLDLSIGWVFGVAGLLMAAMALLSLLNPLVRLMETRIGND